MSSNPRHQGIQVRHQQRCASLQGRRCSCRPSFRAEAFSAADGRKLRKTFGSLAAARAWRAETQHALRTGQRRAAEPVTLAGAADVWLRGARTGAIRNRSGDVYKPSVLRGYEQALRLRVLPAFGRAQLGEIDRGDLQRFVDDMLAAGGGASMIRNTLLPVRAIYRRALSRGQVSVNPTAGLELPAVRGRRERIASPAEASRLLAELHHDRALWAMAMYAGLRLGEIRALQWEAVDLQSGLIHVVRSWDHREGPVAPKSRAGRRAVPVASALRVAVAEHRLRTPWPEGLVFGRSATRPFLEQTVYQRARRAWKRAGLTPITPHECRHTFASLMIAAGVNAKALSTYMGHSSVTITFDLYGHLMPGNEAEAARLLDNYLEGSTAANARGG